MSAIHQHTHDDGHDHDHGSTSGWRTHAGLLIALFTLIIILVLEYGFNIHLSPWPALLINGFAYLLAGSSVLKLAAKKSLRGDFFNEFVLMSVATIGAFIIGEYEEGVAVMVFYQIGEWFQDSAVQKAKKNIKALLDLRPDVVILLQGENAVDVHPSTIKPGDTIRLKPGDRLALDGTLRSASGSFNAAALTGESIPVVKSKGEEVYAGMINLNTVTEIEVSKSFKDSKLSRILDMVEKATARKSQTQLFISRFAKVYTPIVFFLALAVCLLPWLIVDEYIFREWFYRALVFLVISCPCALVVSIPLGYFGGIGLASRNGVLFKGGNFLDVMAGINTVIMDKTGTITKGVFRVQEVTAPGLDVDAFLKNVKGLELHSSHPVAKAVMDHLPETGHSTVYDVEEFPGYGLKGTLNNKNIVAGNTALLSKLNIPYPAQLDSITDTIIVVATDQEYSGHLIISDELKPDAKDTISVLHEMGIHTVMLSGDKNAVTQKIARETGIKEAYGGLLPEDKLAHVQKLKDAGRRTAFAGDGINDAPVIALADAGIAMGALGSDAAIEIADIVIQDDRPSRIISAIKAGRITRNIVWQNIIMAMTVKVAVLALGAGGIASLWEAVIADVGVALLAILNAVRIQGKSLQ